MHSSSAACVLGEARLISSTRSRFAKTGPGRKSNSFVRWSKTLTPVTSDGSKSGVNWMRENEQSSERLGEHRLPDAWKVLDDQVSLADEREDREPQGVLRGVDHLTDVAGDALEDLAGDLDRLGALLSPPLGHRSPRAAARPRPTSRLRFGSSEPWSRFAPLPRKSARPRSPPPRTPRRTWPHRCRRPDQHSCRSASPSRGRGRRLPSRPRTRPAPGRFRIALPAYGARHPSVRARGATARHPSTAFRFSGLPAGSRRRRRP